MVAVATMTEDQVDQVDQMDGDLQVGREEEATNLILRSIGLPLSTMD